MLYPKEFIDLVSHMHGYTNRTSLVSNSAGDSLTDPPCCIGRELMSGAIIKFFGRTDQTNIALLDQIQERHTAPHIFFTHANHKTRARSDQLLASRPPVLHEAAKIEPSFRCDSAVRT